MARLRVDHHRVDRVGLDLPFPPRSAPAPDPVRSVEALEHQAFGALLARTRVRVANSSPVRGAHGGRNDQARCCSLPAPRPPPPSPHPRTPPLPLPPPPPHPPTSPPLPPPPPHPLPAD